MRKKIRKAVAVFIAAITAFSPALSAMPVRADEEGDVDIIPTGQSEIVVEAEAESLPETAMGKLSISLGSGGVLNVSIGDEKEKSYQVDEDGQVKATDKDGNAADVKKTEDGFILVLEEPNGTVVHTKAAADEGYNVATYSVQTDSGAEQELKDPAATVAYDVTIRGNKTLKVGFKEAEVVDIEEDLTGESLEDLAKDVDIPEFVLDEEEAETWKTYCAMTGVDYNSFYEALKAEYYAKAAKERGIASEELVGISGDTLAGVDFGRTKAMTLSQGGGISYGSYMTYARSANGGVNNAVCIMPALTSAGGGTYTGYAIRNGTLRNLMYFAPGAYGYNTSEATRTAYRNITGTDDWAQHYILWHLSMSFAYATVIHYELGITDTSWTKGAGAMWVQRAQEFAHYIDDTIANYISVPDDFQCWIFNTSSGTQPIAAYDMYVPTPTPTDTPTPTPPQEKGDIKLLKKTAKGYEDFVKGNPCYNLEGTTYDVFNSKTDKRVGTLKVKADGTSNVLKDLPAGTYYAKETKAGPGYQKNKDIVPNFELKANQTYTIVAEDIPGNDPFGIEITKIDATTEKEVKAEGAEFTVRYYALDVDNNYKTIEELEKASGGATRTWVMETKLNSAGMYGASFETLIKDRSDAVYLDTDGNPCIPHGFIAIEETKAPKGYGLEGKTMTDESGVEATNGVIISKVYAKHIVAGNKYLSSDYPVEIKTEATDVANGAHTAKKANKVVIVDKVTCTNLTIGEEYTVSGTLMDKKTGEPFYVNGQTVTAEPVTFVADEANCVKEITFRFEGVTLAGETLVAFESLKTRDKEVAVHADINDKNQTVWFPSVATTATDANTKIDQTAIDAEGKIVLRDVVSYSDVEPGATYKLEGRVMDKATGNQVGATKTTEFIAEAEEGSTSMTFSLDAKDINEATELVVFEKMYLVKSILNDAAPKDPVATHENINDERQTVHLVKIGTTLVDANTGDAVVARDTNLKLIDTVAYENLTPNKEYTLIGRLVDKASGEAIVDADGNEIEAEVVFTTPESEDGSVSGTEDVEFEFTLTEAQLDALSGKSMVAFETLSYAGKDIAVHADLNDVDQTVKVPGVKTEAKDVETDSQNSNADEDVTIVDKVTCTNLIIGKDYTVSGTLMDKETGKPLLVNGEEVKAEPVTFTAEESNCIVEITFKFNGVGLEGKTLVAFEDLEHEGRKVATHADIHDKDQTIWIPKIKTTAHDAEAQIQNQEAAKDQKLIDTVAYENLLPETFYTLRAALMDKETVKPVMNNGKAVTAEATFKTGAAQEGKDTAAGTTDVEFVYDATGLENHALVVFETAFLTPEGYTPGAELPKEKMVAVHEDINDVDQTIFIPEIRTHAEDVASKSKSSLPNGVQTIRDDVTYKNLLPDKEYTLTGELVDKKTGKAVTLAESDVADEETGDVEGLAEDVPDDESVTQEAAPADNPVAAEAKAGGTTKSMTFRTPALTAEQIANGETTVSGTVTLEFKVNASTLAGTSLVAFEKVLYNGRELAIHADITDEEQTVHYPEIGTKLVDKADSDKLVLADKKAVVVDTLEYKNLVPGEKYKAVATLMNQASEKALLANGKPVTATKEFTADKSGNGTVDIEIAFDASQLANTTLVAFEKVFVLKSNVEVANHEDIKDEGQTVYIPEIGTKLVNKADSDKLVYAGQSATVSDTVSYKNLIKGEEYRAVATLMDKETGKPVTVGGKAVTGETTFKAEDTSGKVVVDITFDASGLDGHDLVAFEKVYTAKGKVECASHEDIEDKDQTVYIPKIGTVLKNKADGGKTLTAANSVTLSDVVEYSNLIAGRKYVVKGRLMDKSTGKELTVNGRAVTAEATFTAEKESGSVTLDFTFSSNGLGGKSIVAFEKVYTADGKIEVGSHEDINDENQTVKFTTPPGENKKTTGHVQTGDDYRMAVMGAAGFLLLLAAIAFVVLSRKRRETNG